MQNLISRLWNDLRARRLVPVAALLVGALIAAPVVLSKKADESPAPAPAPKAQAKKQSGPEELAQVKLDDAIGKGNGSSLSSFEESNPFAPPDKVVKAAQDETATDNGTAGTAPTDTGAVTPSTGTETGTGGGGDTTGGGTTGGGTPRDRWRRHPQDRRVQLRPRRHVLGQRPQAHGRGPEEARHAAEPGGAAADLHGSHRQRRQRRLPGRLHAERRPARASASRATPTARSCIWAPAPRRSSPTRTAIPTGC